MIQHTVSFVERSPQTNVNTTEGGLLQETYEATEGGNTWMVVGVVRQHKRVARTLHVSVSEF